MCLTAIASTQDGDISAQPLTRHQVRRIDQVAIESLGVHSLVLMENAGRNAADAICGFLCNRKKTAIKNSRVAVICGGGNNGGDGFVVARHLYNAGADVCLLLAVEPKKFSPDAAANHLICQKMGIKQTEITNATSFGQVLGFGGKYHVLVDALLGTGFVGKVRSHMVQVISTCNQQRSAKTSIVALDVPSGLDCDTGKPSNATIMADLTVTFVAQKRGFLQPGAREHLGQVTIADIGVPPELIAQVRAENPGV